MLTKPLLLGALAASGAVAQLPLAGHQALQARVLDDMDASPSCSSARDSLLSVYAQMPTPAAVLDDAALPTGVCDEPSFTGETAQAWSSFTSAAIALLASNTAVISSAFSACPDLVGRLPDIPDCAATATPAPTGTGASPTGTGASTTGASASTTGSGASAGAGATESSPTSSPTPNQNAAPRMGSIVGTVWVAAGLVGVVAAL